MSSKSVVNGADLLKWVAAIKEIRARDKDLEADVSKRLDADTDKCIKLAKQLLQPPDGPFSKLHIASVLEPGDGKEPAKETKIGPQLPVTAFRLQFGWGPKATTGVIKIEDKHYASIGDPFAVHEIDSLPRGQEVPWHQAADVVVVKWAEDGKSIERHIIAHPDFPGVWNVGAFGSDLLEFKSFDGGRLVLRLTEADEQFIEKWVQRMALEAIPLVEQQVWQQLEEQQKRQKKQPLSEEAERLRAALIVANTVCKKWNPASLQHVCSLESECDWHFLDPEWALCIGSANLHRCTVTECKFRDDVGGELRSQKEDGGYSVCRLTSRAREPVEFVVAGRTPFFKPHKHTKNPLDWMRDEAKALIARILRTSTKEKPPDAICAVCCRVWSLLFAENSSLSKQCSFEAVCVYLLVEMGAHGLSVRLADKTLAVIPESAFLNANIRSTEELNKMGLVWTINISKLLCTALVGLGEARLRELGDEFRGLCPM